MRKLLAPLLLAALLLCGCGSDSAGGDSWVLPTIEPAPTAAPTATPAWTDGSLAPEQYIWNEALSVNMSDPGVSGQALPAELNHSESFALFGGQFLPDDIFNESYAKYGRLRLQKSSHQVLVDADGGLAGNAYVEYRYLPKNGDEGRALTVMAELCGYDRVMEIYSGAAYPHVLCPEGVRPQSSVYYLDRFLLVRAGGTRFAQWLLLPSAYFTYAETVRRQAEESEQEPDIQAQVLLTFSCGADMSDEEFIAAVIAVEQYGVSAIRLPSLAPPTLAPGDKGYA